MPPKASKPQLRMMGEMQQITPMMLHTHSSALDGVGSSVVAGSGSGDVAVVAEIGRRGSTGFELLGNMCWNEVDSWKSLEESMTPTTELGG